MMKSAVRKVGLRIGQLSKYIDATTKHLYKKSPFMEGKYSSYNPDTGFPNTKVDEEPIWKGPMKKATNKLQEFNKKCDKFKDKVPNGDIYKNMANIEEEIVESNQDLGDLSV